MAKEQYNADSITVLKDWKRSVRDQVCISDEWDLKD